jgi:hypothetical protein
MIALLLDTHEKKIDLDPEGQTLCTKDNILNARSSNPHTENINFTVGGTNGINKSFPRTLSDRFLSPTVNLPIQW